MFRFDSKIGYYLYLDSDKNSQTELLLNKGNTYDDNVSVRDDIKVIKHRLRIPNKFKDYQDFSKKMIEAEKQFLRDFKDVE